MRYVCILLLLVILQGGRAAGRPQAAAQRGAGASEPLATLMDEGQEVYGIDCVECHADGGMGPSLVGNFALANRDRVVKAILAGVSDGDMPAFGPNLTDRKVAAVATYVRNAWDNQFGVVLEADVKRLREEGKK
jgi:mono/diheme cytochrome c family protein